MSSAIVLPFPQTQAPHFATVRDKTRNSGLTSVCFFEHEKVICADFNEKTAYLASVRNGTLDILDRVPTRIADGTPVQTDLMDRQGNRFAVSNFYQGSVSFYVIEDDKISFEREMNLNHYKGLHGVRFIPGASELVWLTYCGGRNKCHQIVDINTDHVLHHFDTDQQCQDVAFLGDYAVVFARTDHITAGTKKAPLFSKKRRMFATAYIYRLPPDLRKGPPEFVGRWKGMGHIDACKGHDGHIYAANQYLNRVDVFTLSPAGDLSLSRTITGLDMPHGLDLKGNQLAVTNYSDSTLRMMTV